MKKLGKILLLCIIGVMCLPLTVMAETTGSMMVTGNGSVKVEPDIAYANVGVRVSKSSASEASRECATAIEKLIAGLKELGIKDEDIKTQSYYITPEYDYTGKTSEVTGYTSTHMLTVTVHNIDSVGDVLTKAANSGANQIYNINFSVADAQKYYSQALGLAIANAKGKAQVIASALGVSMGKVIQISENGGYSAPMYAAGVQFETAKMAMDAGVPISAGELEITAHIQMVVEY